MNYKNPRIQKTAQLLKDRLTKLDNPSAVLRATELKILAAELKTLPKNQRAVFGKEINQLKRELLELAENRKQKSEIKSSIDVTAPWDVNTPPEKRPRLLPAEEGTKHPLMGELELVLNIFTRMGFSAIESRQLDDDYHMFTSLNFPKDHPARDDYDSFVTKEGLIAPAHTSTMQNRVLKAGRKDLAAGRPIAVVIPGRVFRNEDVDARHEHTFYQLEGVYVDKNVHAGHLISTLKTFLEEYYGQKLEVRTQPFYFPFTEPSFEFALSCPFCLKAGCQVCSYEGWLELLGCGLIHPNVLKMAGIDPLIYSGFAWGGGIDRLVMVKHGVEDVRHFHGGRLDFLRQFR